MIIDSLAAACGSDLSNPDTPIRFFTALRTLSVGSLIFAHVAKNSEQQTIYGSVFFKNFARSVWEIQSVQDGRELKVGLFNRKCNFGLHAPIGLRYTFLDDAVRIDHLNLDEHPLPEKGLSVPEQVRKALADEKQATAGDLAEVTGLPVDRVKTALSRGADRWCKTAGKRGLEYLCEVRT